MKLIKVRLHLLANQERCRLQLILQELQTGRSAVLFEANI